MSDQSSFHPGQNETKSLLVLYEDHDCLVLNKPSGLAVHEAPGIRREHTVIGILEKTKNQKEKTKDHTSEIHTEATSLNPIHSPVFLVHRLDQETSGCLLVAKNERVKEYFEKLFKDGKVDKEYVALVKGVPSPRRGRIDRSLEGRKGEKVGAVTMYEVKNIFPSDGVSFVKVRILTGRMHQIRKHFAFIRHPVVMDAVYGDFRFNKMFRKAFGLKRLFLHAASLSFVAPSGKRVSVTASLPSDIQSTLEQLS